MTSASSRHDSLLTLRSLLWVALMPGTVAGLIPWLLLGLRDARVDMSDPLHAIGMASICVGVALLGWCGYPTVTAILLGELALTRSSTVLVYLLGFLVVTNVFVIGYEEPKLRSQFGASYEDYARRVGRWLPRGAAR